MDNALEININFLYLDEELTPNLKSIGEDIWPTLASERRIEVGANLLQFQESRYPLNSGIDVTWSTCDRSQRELTSLACLFHGISETLSIFDLGTLQNL